MIPDIENGDKGVPKERPQEETEIRQNPFVPSPHTPAVPELPVEVPAERPREPEPALPGS